MRAGHACRSCSCVPGLRPRVLRDEAGFPFVRVSRVSCRGYFAVKGKNLHSIRRSTPAAASLRKKSGKLFRTACAPQIVPPVPVQSTASAMTMRWSLCPQSGSPGAWIPLPTRISLSPISTLTPNLRSSSCMAVPRSLSLIRRRRVSVNLPPWCMAAKAKSTGPRSGQSARDMPSG